MKKMYLYVALALATCVLLALTGCEGPTGPKGPKGEPGVAECMECHAEDTGLIAIEAQWANSVHATGANFARNTPPCSGCHTSEGFIAKLATGSPGTPTNPSAIHCFTCHAPHSNGDFRLRAETAVNLEQGGVFDRGHGNLCAICHQARKPFPVIAHAPDSTIIGNAFWGPHHGPQASMLSGNGGYEFPGHEYGDSPHTMVVTNGCPSCHMAVPFGAQAGGHTMNMTYESQGAETDLVTGCNVKDCHWGAVTNFSFAGAQAEVGALLDELRAALQAKGIIDSSGAVVPGKYSEAETGALYNFLFVDGDGSVGIHNTEYARALLQASLAELGVGGPIAYHKSGQKQVRHALR
jgi:hypothetical protein